MIRIVIIAILMISVNSFSSEAQAQRRGRFFQKFKDEFFGSPQAQQTAAQQKAQQLAAQQKQLAAQRAAAAKQQQLRSQYPGVAPSRAPNGRVPTPVTSSSRTRTPSSPLNSIYNRSNSTNTPTRQAPSRSPTAKAGSSSRQKAPELSKSGSLRRPVTRSTRNGFGFQIALAANDNLVVSSVERGSNAEEAGIKRGDKILEIGGIEATSVEEFEEIAKIMGQGDELEFKIARASGQQKMNVRYGELPELEEEEEEVERPALSTSSSEKRYDFSPPSNSDGRSPNSVLSRSQSQSQSGYQSVSSTRNDAANRQIRLLNQRIGEQNRQIQKLQLELQKLQSGRRSR